MMNTCASLLTGVKISLPSFSKEHSRFFIFICVIVSHLNKATAQNLTAICSICPYNYELPSPNAIALPDSNTTCAQLDEEAGIYSSSETICQLDFQLVGYSKCGCDGPTGPTIPPNSASCTLCSSGISTPFPNQFYNGLSFDDSEEIVTCLDAQNYAARLSTDEDECSMFQYYGGISCGCPNGYPADPVCTLCENPTERISNPETILAGVVTCGMLEFILAMDLEDQYDDDGVCSTVQSYAERECECSAPPSTVPSSSGVPSTIPSLAPSTSRPTSMPSSLPTSIPTRVPSTNPSLAPSTSRPTLTPSSLPTSIPTTPSPTLSKTPSNRPTSTQMPSSSPTIRAPISPSTSPSEGPTITLSDNPTITHVPTITQKPSNLPTEQPSTTQMPSSVPTDSTYPSVLPSGVPSTIPTTSMEPTILPSDVPTTTVEPSAIPTTSMEPTIMHSDAPSTIPTTSMEPTILPSNVPTITGIPSVIPTTSMEPTILPSNSPSISRTPSATPSSLPSSLPSSTPSKVHSSTPTTSNPPSQLPIHVPSATPMQFPSDIPSKIPSSIPSTMPSKIPSSIPSVMPSTIPSDNPSLNPSFIPSTIPTKNPSIAPTSIPSSVPSITPSNKPSQSPSVTPSSSPTISPSANPTLVPSISPTEFLDREVNCTAIREGSIPQMVTDPGASSSVRSEEISKQYYADLYVANGFLVNRVLTDVQDKWETRISTVMTGCEQQQQQRRLGDKIPNVSRNLARRLQSNEKIIYYVSFSNIGRTAANVPCRTNQDLVATECYSATGLLTVSYLSPEDASIDAREQEQIALSALNTLKERGSDVLPEVEGLVAMSISEDEPSQLIDNDDANPRSNNQLSSGSKAAIGVGAAGSFALVVGLLIFMRGRKNRMTESQAQGFHPFYASNIRSDDSISNSPTLEGGRRWNASSSKSESDQSSVVSNSAVSSQSVYSSSLNSSSVIHLEESLDGVEAIRDNPYDESDGNYLPSSVLRGLLGDDHGNTSRSPSATASDTVDL